MVDVPAAIEGFADASQAQVMLFQSGRQVQAPALKIGLQPLDAGLTDIAGLSPADGNFIVGNGTNWIAESGATALASLGIVASTWTPTLTAVANVASATPVTSYYIRVGSNVVCFLSVSVDPTAGTTVTQLGISLPVASDFASQDQCSGAMNSNSLEVGRVVADATNNRAELRYTSASTGATVFFGVFGYVTI